MSAYSEQPLPQPSAKALGKRRVRSFDEPDPDDAAPHTAPDAAKTVKKSKAKKSPETYEDSEDEELYRSSANRPRQSQHITPPKIKVPWKHLYDVNYNGSEEEEEEVPFPPSLPQATQPVQRSEPSLELTIPVVAAPPVVVVAYANCEPACPRPSRRLAQSILSCLDLNLLQSPVLRQAVSPDPQAMIAARSQSAHPSRASRSSHGRPSRRDGSYSPTRPANEEDDNDDVEPLEVDPALRAMVAEHGIRVLDMDVEDRLLLMLEQGSKQRAEIRRLEQEVREYRDKVEDQDIKLDHYRDKFGDLPTGLELDRDIYRTKVDLSTADKHIAAVEYVFNEVLEIIAKYRDDPAGRAVGEAFDEWHSRHVQGHETDADRARRAREEEEAVAGPSRGRSVSCRGRASSIPSPSPTTGERRRMVEAAQRHEEPTEEFSEIFHWSAKDAITGDGVLAVPIEPATTVHEEREGSEPAVHDAEQHPMYDEQPPAHGDEQPPAHGDECHPVRDDEQLPSSRRHISQSNVLGLIDGEDQDGVEYAQATLEYPEPEPEPWSLRRIDYERYDSIRAKRDHALAGSYGDGLAGPSRDGLIGSYRDSRPYTTSDVTPRYTDEEERRAARVDSRRAEECHYRRFDEQRDYRQYDEQRYRDEERSGADPKRRVRAYDDSRSAVHAYRRSGTYDDHPSKAYDDRRSRALDDRHSDAYGDRSSDEYEKRRLRIYDDYRGINGEYPMRANRDRDFIVRRGGYRRDDYPERRFDNYLDRRPVNEDTYSYRHRATPAFA
ncbi:hypothetical protein BD626DRAFT_167045 [Schizophyllum amplum]|uniref:Uncharacterized protein n=1 Tax=Schizophyllum amplum TaxID=97359 RepID=A0A550CQ65_9AGAR|nr:hypothetical protein BD626DRAFT_167045 [Auriculariopsis ampla]